MAVDKKYSYDRFDTKGARAGQAVYDILSKDQPDYTVEEILEEMGKGIASYIQEEAERGCKKFDGTFYILHLFKKSMGEMNVANAMVQSARSFQTQFNIQEVMQSHPNSAKTLYEVDKKNGLIKLLWTVPGWEDCKSIKKNPGIYDPDLVKWVNMAIQGIEGVIPA